MACRSTAEEKYGYEDSRFEKDIDAHFHCSICYNVLKEPMMCRNNEHVFCRACITEHLTVNSQTCPECNENLTIETLRRGPRLVLNYLSELKIKCEYSSRGCLELIRLEELDAHVKKCDFAPVKCSNEGCEMVISKRERIHHETTMCENRKVKCHSCEKLEKDVEEMKVKVVDVAGDVNQVKRLMAQMFEKLGFLENTMQIASAVNQASNALMGDILVAAGYNKHGPSDDALKSAERFSWKKNVWKRVSSLNVGRIAATSFVYENQLFVAGGCGSDAIEVSNLNEDLLHWDECIATLPYECQRLRSVVYQNRLILFCACRGMDACAELSLTAPYTCKLLCEMPEQTKSYTVVAFEHKVLIFGGTSLNDEQFFDSVSEFDINMKEFSVMPSLPYAATNMAAVRWGDQAVLIGGLEKDGPSKKVCMYDSKTGNTNVLPSMLEERTGCCAIITGNTIVVMGGLGLERRVRSVEAFTMGGYSWRYLPAMNGIRSGATATVLPAKH